MCGAMTTKVLVNPPERPQTVREVAALMSYHPESVRRAIRAGRIRALKFGQDWRVPPAEVQRILSEGLPA